MVEKKFFAFLGVLAVSIVLLVIDISTPTTIISPAASPIL